MPTHVVLVLYGLSLAGCATCCHQSIDLLVEQPDIKFAEDHIQPLRMPPLRVLTTGSTPPLEHFVAQPPPGMISALVDDIQQDHVEFYSPESLSWLAAAVGIGALMANTTVDVRLNRRFQSNVRNAKSDDWFESLHAQKELGNGHYTLPVMAAAWASGEIFSGVWAADVAGDWGERSLRSILTAAPPLLFFQYASGASRPGEAATESKWVPFHDTNGVSGHSFMGSLPFLTAARMAERPLLKAAFYAGSTLAPLSRINDEAHYPSQALVGWALAFLAVEAVDRVERAGAKPTILPWVDGTAIGVAVEVQR